MDLNNIAGKSPVVIFANDKTFADLVCDKAVQGRHPLTLESTTILKHNKFDRAGKGHGRSYAEAFPKGEVYCSKKEYVSLGLDYQVLVNRQRAKEGLTADFVAESLPWGQWYGTAHTVIEHKGNYYLRYTLRRNANYYYSSYINHYADGSRLTAAETELFYEQFASEKSETTRQGVEDPIEVRAVKVSGVSRAVVNGTTYIRDGFQNREDTDKLEDWITKAVVEIEKTVRAAVGL